MRAQLAAFARAVVDLVAPAAEVREKALPAPTPLLSHVTVPEMKRAETLAEFWTLHHLPLLQDGRVSA